MSRCLLLLAVLAVLVYSAVTPSFTAQNTVPQSRVGVVESNVLPH